MAKITDGWGFVEEGEIYMLKKDFLIAEILIVSNHSDNEIYFFDFKVLKANYQLDKGIYTINVKKNAVDAVEEIFNRFADLGEMKHIIQEA